MKNVPLGKVVTFKGGGTPSRKIDSYWNGGIPWATVKDFNSGVILKSTQENISSLGLEKSASNLIPRGSLIIPTRMGLGRAVICDIDVAINQDLKAIFPENHELDVHYLLWFFLANSKKIERMGKGATVKGVTLDQLKALKIPLPPLPIQKKIAAVLEKADELRKKRQEQIKRLDDLLQATFLDMFGDPVTNPKGWKVNKLKNISTRIMSGNTPKGGQKNYVEEGITFFRSQNVWRNNLDLDDVAYITDETHAKMAKSSLKNKDILMTKTGRINTENSSLGRAAIYLGEDDRANINGHVYLIRLLSDVAHRFVLYILTTGEYREYIRSVCVGGIDKRQINKDHLEEFPIIAPPVKLQKKFAKEIEKIESQKQIMKESLSEIDDLFNSLMQKAFKGELNLT